VHEACGSSPSTARCRRRPYSRHHRLPSDDVPIERTDQGPGRRYLGANPPSMGSKRVSRIRLYGSPRGGLRRAFVFARLRASIVDLEKYYPNYRFRNLFIRARTVCESTIATCVNGLTRSVGTDVALGARRHYRVCSRRT
jgi:hypothetical protein